MASLARLADSVLVVVDIQPSFLNAIHGKEQVLHRSEFLVRMAAVLGIPVLATEQYPERMGATLESLVPFLCHPAPGKKVFSCAGCEEFVRQLKECGKTQAVLVGIETHICVNQTAHDLLSRGFEVIVCGDAVGSRTPDRHEIGLERIRSAGAAVAHTESVAYEWLHSADHPRFREALEIVKAFA